MSLTSVNLTTNLSWAFDRTNTPFGDTTQGPDSQIFSLNSVDVTVFDELLTASYTIVSGSHVDIDVSSFTNLVYESTGLTRALSMMVLPAGTGSVAVLSPSPTSGLAWFLGNSTGTGTPSITINPGGMFAFSEPAASSGAVVDSSHKNLRISNIGSQTLTATVLILGAD